MLTVRAVMVPMVGRRFGRWTVIAGPVGRRWRENSPPQLLYRVRCDCGTEVVMEGRRLRRPAGEPGSTRQCNDCRKRENADRQRTKVSVMLPAGETVAQVAARTGIKLDTVYHRWIRRWRAEDLDKPARTRQRRTSC